MTIYCPNCKKKVKLGIKGNDIPLVNNFNIDKRLYTTDFHYCKKCDLGFLKYFHDDKKLYNKNYLYRGQLSKDKIWFIKKIIKENINKKITILEIGGGDGYIGKLLNKEVSYTNVDPSSRNGYNSKTKFFEKTNIRKKFDLIICLNVLAHIDNPKKIIDKINKISHKKSKIILTVQNGLDQVKSGFLDNIYHEHKYYYSPLSFKNKLLNLNFSLKYFKSTLHGESIIATNINLNLKKYKKLRSNLNRKILIKSQIKYNEALKKIKIKIDQSKKKIWGVGCAPRAIKLLYDLKNYKEKIIGIIEPKKSLKLNFKLPKTNIKILNKNEKIIGRKNIILWFPWHIIPPKIFKKVIWPYH